MKNTTKFKILRAVERLLGYTYPPAGMAPTGEYGEIIHLFCEKINDQAVPMQVNEEAAIKEFAREIMERNLTTFSVERGEQGVNRFLWGLMVVKKIDENQGKCTACKHTDDNNCNVGDICFEGERWEPKPQE